MYNIYSGQNFLVLSSCKRSLSHWISARGTKQKALWKQKGNSLPSDISAHHLGDINVAPSPHSWSHCVKSGMTVAYLKK